MQPFWQFCALSRMKAYCSHLCDFFGSKRRQTKGRPDVLMMSEVGEGLQIHGAQTRTCHMRAMYQVDTLTCNKHLSAPTVEEMQSDRESKRLE